MSEEHESKRKEVMLFGRDVSHIPCFRNTIFYGISGGLGFGLLRFMLTSKVLSSVNFSVYSFTLISMGYWVQCRYNYSKTKFEMQKLQEALQNKSILDGTYEEERLKAEIELNNPVEV